jgi:DNA-binding NtrC family response regulator
MDFEILIVDDKLADAEAVAEILSELANVKPVVLDNPERALELFERNTTRFALVLIDFNLNIKNLNGLVLAKKIWKINSQQLIAIFSGEASLDAPIKCVGTPIVEFITKGASATVTQKKVQNLLQKYAATHRPMDISGSLNENQAICASAGLVAKSAAMASLSKSVGKVAGSNTATVLIRGASGTGKELVARAIHNLSQRKDGPFIPINMGAFQSTLIESELFGHEKGSFTGASNARQGSFELANGGTIFLDEIGELPLDLQVKLLRVLQEREVQPVGATKPIKIDVRVVAATHVNLETQIASGKFRFDLFQRLNVITLDIPRLCERIDDLELLAKHFLNKYKSSKRIHQQTLMQMERYEWPGNVRELENLIQKLDILTDDQEILPQHLPSEIFVAPIEQKTSASFDFTMSFKNMTQHIRDLEKGYYVYHLTKAKSVRDAAINRMDMPPSTLRGKMDFYEIAYKGAEIESNIENTKEDQSEQSL